MPPEPFTQIDLSMDYRTLLSVFSAFTFCYCAAAAEPKTLSRRVDAITRAWNKVPAEVLRDPSNADVLDELRRKARLSSNQVHRALLLRIGDPETVQTCIKDLYAEVRDTGAAFIDSGNVRLILSLCAPLFEEESARSERFMSNGEASYLRPVSVRAAWAIREMIRSGSAFSPEVVEWATNLRIGVKDGEAGRQKIREWVTVNKNALETGNFAAAKVPD